MYKQQKQDPIYINNTFIEENSDDFQELVYQLKNNTEFSHALIPIWNLFSINYQGEIMKADLKKYLARVFQFLIYILRKGDNEALAEEECQRLLNNDQETISLQVFTEMFAYLTSKWIENPQLDTAIAFLKLIFERTTQLVIKDTNNKLEDQVISHNIIVHLYTNDKIEENFNVVQKDLLYPHNIYYEESVKLDEEAVRNAENDHQKTLKRGILNFSQIIPLGYSCESYVDTLRNNGFTPEQNTQLPHLSPSDKFQGIQNIKIIPQFEENIIDQIKQYCQEERIIKISSVLHKHLQSQGRFTRLNTLVQRQIYFEHFKIKNKDEEKYINVLSDFLCQADYNIDEIDQLHRKKQEKLTRKKQQENGEDFKPSIKKEIVDHENLKKTLNFQLLKNVQTFQIKDNLLTSIKELKNLNQEANKYNENELEFKQYTSKYNSLPKDTQKPYSEDILEFANQVPLQVLIIGKPKTGKTTFCQEFAKQVNIVHIEPLLLIEKALNRIKDFEENPPEMDDDGNPKEVLPQCDLKVKEMLENGQEIQAEVMLDLVNNELKHHLAINKGFILDLPLCNRAYEFSWIDAIVRNKVLLPKIGCRYFSHIIEFEHSDEEVLEFMEKHMENPETGRLYSQFDRDILRKPKKKVGEEGEEEEEEEPPADDEDEDAKKPQDEKDIAYLPNNRDEIIKEQLDIFNKKTKKQIYEFHSHLSLNKHLKFAPAGLNCEEIVQIALKKLGDEVEVLRPLAIKLEGGSEKEQLTIEGQKIYRQWSTWYQTDCVELFHKGKVVQGRGDLACDYGGRVFLFENEENHQKFFENPRKYLSQPPQLPQTYNIAIVGPRCSGKKTYAKKLAAQYNLKLIDIEQIICEALMQQKQTECEHGHQPSNFEPRADDVHLSEQEWKEFFKGKEVNSKDVWPIILHKLGCKLQKKPEGWGVEKKDDEDEENQEEEKKKNAKKPVKKQVKDTKKEGDDDRPKTPPVEDLPLKEIIQQIQEDGKTIPPVQGLIIVGQPMNEEQINILKYHNIPIDKVVCLLDTSEEEPGKVLSQRPGFDDTYNLEQEMTTITTAQGLLKETYGEENVKDIHIGGSIEEVYNRIRTNIDPFFIRPDDEAFVRVQGDVNAEEEDNIVYGEYGPYCPVTLKDDGWLIPGKFDNPEKGESIEAYVQGRRHLFFSENEQTKFKENVFAYYDEGKKVQVPPPRVMFMGVRGAGIHTQLQLLQRKYKVPVMDFKENLQAQLLNERQKRANTRLCNEIGFQPPPTEEDEGAGQVENKDPEDFDYKQHELDLTKKIFKEVQQVFINGNFYKPVPPEDETQVDPNDQTMVPITAELNELLNETKKLPEAIFYLQVNDDQFMKRTYDQIEQSLIDKYDKEIQDKKDEKERKRKEIEEIRAKQIEEGVEEDQLEPFEEEEEEDPNAYQEGLQAILTAKKEELMAQKTQDQEQLDALTGEFDNMGIPIIPIQCNRAIEKVFDQICFKLKSYLEQRENLLEKYQCFEIKRPQQEEDDEGNAPVDPLVHYEKSYNYKKSRYHDRNPISLIDVPRNVEFPLIYRNRIYYLQSKEQLNQIKIQPLKFLTRETFPNDVKNRPRVIVIGKPKCGKSTLAKLLSEKLQLVRIKPSNILEDFIEEHDYLLSQQAKECQRSGKEVPDEVLVELILKRVQMADCIQQGWVLDGFPKTRKQAEIFSKRQMIPTNVFSLKLDNFKVIQRARQVKSNKFGYNDIILHSQIQKEENHINQLENYYILNYNSIRFLDSQLSKWGIFDQAKKAIYSSISQRQSFARSLITDQPVQVNSLCLTQRQILYNLGSFENYSPVALKTNRQFIKNSISSQNLVYFDRFLYILNTAQEIQDFLKRPDLYLYQKLKKMEVPRNVYLGSIVSCQQEIQCKSHCMGNLLNNKLEKSMLDILATYKGKTYSFSSFKQRNNFKANPQKYMNVKLPDKLPVTFNKKNLVKKVAKKGDCTAYLEHHLGDKVMRVLAQLGYKRLKYPTINCKETALKFIAISLKALNPNKDEVYRKKYMDKLQVFLKHCNFSETISKENSRKNMCWKDSDDKDFNSIAELAERQVLLENIHSVDPWNEHDEEKYTQIKQQYHQLLDLKNSDRWTEDNEKQLNDTTFEYKNFLAHKKYRSQSWQAWDEENLLKITEEFAEFMDNLQNEDKDVFFKKFIR